MNRVFIFKCKMCNKKVEWDKGTTPSCCQKKMIRDYKSEAVSLNRENIRAVKSE